MRIAAAPLLLLGACASDALLGEGIDVAARGPGDAVVQVRITVACDDAPCSRINATALTLHGTPVAWDWDWDGQQFQGREVQLQTFDGLEVLSVAAAGINGQVARASVAVSMMPGDPLYAEPFGIVFVPLTGPCSNIPIMTIGGCFLDSADPLDLSISGEDTADVTFSRNDFLDGLPDPYISVPDSLEAVWRVGVGLLEGSSPGTPIEMYDDPAYPHPPFPTEHLTVYFQGYAPGMSTVVTSHAAHGKPATSKYVMRVYCDAAGQVDRVDRLVVADMRP